MTHYAMDSSSLCYALALSLSTTVIPSTDIEIVVYTSPTLTCSVNFVIGGGVALSTIVLAADDTVRIIANRCSACYELLDRYSTSLGSFLVQNAASGSVAPTDIGFCVSGKCCCCCACSTDFLLAQAINNILAMNYLQQL